MKKSLKKNFILQILYQILLIISPLITAPYIARVLGADNVGINSYSYAITSYFVMVAALGIENYGSRLVAQNRNNNVELNRVFTELFLIHFLVSFIVFLCFIAYCLFWVKNNKTIFFIQSLYILGIVLDINWLFFGLEEFEIIVVKNSIIKIVSVIMIFVLVKNYTDLALYVGILAIGTFLNYVVLWGGIKKRVVFVNVSISNCFSHLKPLIILFLPSIAWSLYKYMDKIMLMNMVDSSAVGYYDSGERIIVLSLGLINALGVVMLPRVSNLKACGNEKKVEEYFLKSILMIGFISCGCCIGAFCIADDFVPLFFGEGYDPAIIVMKGLAITLPFSAFANVIKTQFILPNNKDSFFATTMICGAIINFIVNFMLIPRFGVLGATIGTICTETFVCILQIVISNREMKTIAKMFKASGFLVAGLIMGILINMLNVITIDVIRLLSKIMIGGIVYAIMSAAYCYWIDKEFCIEIIDQLLLKLKTKK